MVNTIKHARLTLIAPCGNTQILALRAMRTRLWLGNICHGEFCITRTLQLDEDLAFPVSTGPLDTAEFCVVKEPRWIYVKRRG